MKMDRLGADTPAMDIGACIARLMDAAMPAASMADCEQSLDALLTTLVELLRLDFAWAGLLPHGQNPGTERLHPAGMAARAAGVVDEALRQCGGDRHGKAARIATGEPRDGETGVAVVQLGVHVPVGTLVLGAARPGFPQQAELLVLRVAAAQLTACTEALRASRSVPQDELAAELATMQRLHEFSTRLLREADLQAILEEAMDATMALQDADFGCVQRFDPVTGNLHVVAQRGFDEAFMAHFANANDDAACCGRAIQERRRVVIEDVWEDEIFGPHRGIANAAGFRAVQTTPLFSRAGEPLGAISTHFRLPHSPSAHALRATDLYAALAAETIERRRNEQERATLASVVENSPDFIGIAQLDGKVLFVNPAGRRLVGLESEEHAQRTHIDDYLGPDDRQRYRQTVLPSLQRDGRWEGESQAVHLLTGEIIPVRQHIFFIKEEGSGRHIAMATIARDISEDRRAEKALHRTRSELAHVMRVTSMGELAASIAHEVNQPLAAIAANGDACRRWLALTPPNMAEANESLARIVRDARHASEVIQRIRGFLLRGENSVSSVDIRDTISDVIRLVKQEAHSHRVRLLADSEPGLPQLRADRTQLQQVLLNLVMNAIESLAGMETEERIVRIGARRAGTEEIIVSVSDNGTGIHAEHRDKIFGPFHTTKQKGLGMGLAISRSIIEAHGGRIWASPNAGRGETFQFLLPIGETDAA